MHYENMQSNSKYCVGVFFFFKVEQAKSYKNMPLVLMFLSLSCLLFHTISLSARKTLEVKPVNCLFFHTAL